MASTNTLIVDLENLLAAAKSTNLQIMDNATRMDLLSQVEGIHHQLDDPLLAMYRHLVNFTTTSALQTVLSIGALHHISRDAKFPTKAKVIADRLKLPEELISRFLRQLVAVRILDSPSDNTYVHTPFSLSYIERDEVNFITLVLKEFAPPALALPSYLSSHSTEPSKILSPTQGPISWSTNNPGLSFYEILATDPVRLENFHVGMAMGEAQQRMKGVFPMAELVSTIASKQKDGVKNRAENGGEEVLIVDVGGGTGQSLVAIQQELREEGVEVEGLGSWVLQDRPGVIASIPKENLPGIKKQAHDFFTPQPIKGAKIYHLRRCLHNHPQESCLQILQNTAAAMSSESTLLIGEMVIPDKAGANKYVYHLDIIMLLIGGKERTKTEWNELVDGAGLKILKIWGKKGADQCMIECVLK